MRRLSTSFLDLFLLLLMSVVVMVKPVTEDAPEELTHFIVTATWEDVDNDVDIWGKRCGVADTECGFTRREVSNLRLHGDWTGSTYGMHGELSKFAFETMTIDAIIAGEYGFSLEGYSLRDSTTVKITVASVKPYRLLIDKEVVVEHGQWTSIGRVSIDGEGKVLMVDESLEVNIMGDNRD